uniref:Uncharacterized protein n=1 Tax=Pithovirus LCPAC304 TaxID=2506594 RepID=A0A481Z8N1_9VIRU|nr:MAG: hypothetical protein LCPAC304_02980 [Pithovirus LCPAC304]
MLSGDTRFTTVELIETAVTSYCKDKESTDYLRTKEIKRLEQARTGIKNLGNTYANTSIEKRLEQCHQRLRELITDKRERSSSSDEERPHSPSDSSSEEFEIEEQEENLLEQEENLLEQEEKLLDQEENVPEKEDVTTISDDSSHTPPSYALPLVPPKPKKEDTEKDDSVCPKRASKFDKYVKKKGWIGGRTPGSSELQGHELRGSSRSRTVSQSRRKSSPSNSASSRESPGLHIITMGDVLSEFDTLPETISNPLSVLSHPSKPRDVRWYREHFVRE